MSDSHAWHCRARCIESFVGAHGALKASKSLLSHAWHCRARCIESFVGAHGALKASKSLLLIPLKQECSPVFYIGE